jgi:PBSX family phage terminase large subunit
VGRDLQSNEGQGGRLTTGLEWGDFYTDSRGRLSKYIPIHEGQADILKSSARFTAVIAGTGAGKTTAGAVWLGQRIAAKPTGKFLMVAPTFPLLNTAALETWKKFVEGTELQGEYKQQAHEYHLPTGGKIYCRSGEHPDSFEGVQYDGGVWLDEGGNCSVKVWHAIQRRSGYHKCPVLITTTPYANYTWLKTELIDRHKAGDKNYLVRQFPSTLNPTYDKAEFDRAKTAMSDWRFRMMYMGEFCGASGLVYPEMSKCFVDQDEIAKASANEPRYYGAIDWGGGSATADPFCALVGMVDDNDCLWVFFERYVSGERNDLLANAAKLKEWHQTFYAKHRQEVRRWWADASRPTSISLFRQMAGLTIRKANNQAGAIATGIDLVTARIKTGRLKIVKDTCKGLLTESELYRYATGDDDEAHGDTPRDQHNHAMDALR